MLRVFLTLVFFASLFLLQDHFSELSQVSDRGNGHISAAKSFKAVLFSLSIFEMFGWFALILGRISINPLRHSILSEIAGVVTFGLCLASMLLSMLALGHEDQAGGVPYQYELMLFYVLKVVCLAGLMIEGFLWFFGRQANNSQSAFYAPGRSSSL